MISSNYIVYDDWWRLLRTRGRNRDIFVSITNGGVVTIAQSCVKRILYKDITLPDERTSLSSQKSICALNSYKMIGVKCNPYFILLMLRISNWFVNNIVALRIKITMTYISNIIGQRSQISKIIKIILKLKYSIAKRLSFFFTQ